jgi:hypothetical protein
MISDQERKLAEQVINLHDGKNFDLLREISMSPSPDESEGTVTEDMYVASCKDIQQELGVVTSIEFIDALTRADSQLTLWRAKYSSSEDEVLWAIGFDSETHKVKDVLVNW